MCATRARAIRAFSFQLSAISFQSFTDILFIGNDHSERADRGSRRSRRVGDYRVRFYERGTCRSAPLGYKYPHTKPNWSLFVKKYKINLRNCNFFCNFVADLKIDT